MPPPYTECLPNQQQSQLSQANLSAIESDGVPSSRQLADAGRSQPAILRSNHRVIIITGLLIGGAVLITLIITLAVTLGSKNNKNGADISGKGIITRIMYIARDKSTKDMKGF